MIASDVHSVAATSQRKRYMADGVPLRPRLEPGQYRGRWLIPDETGIVQELDGDLDLTAGCPPVLSIWGRVPLVVDDGGSSVSFPQRFSHPCLVGELRNGPKAILVDAQVQTWEHDQASVYASAALVGPPRGATDGALNFDEITVQITGLDAFAGIGPIKSFTYPKAGQGFYEHTWQVAPNPDSEQRWSDDGATLAIKWTNAIAMESLFFRIAFSPVATITLIEPVGLDSCLTQWIEPLSRLISLATGRTEKITYLSLGRPNQSGGGFQVYGTGLDQVPFASRDNDVRNIHTAFHAATEDSSPLHMIRS